MGAVKQLQIEEMEKAMEEEQRKEDEMWILKASKIIDQMVYLAGHMKPHLEFHQVRDSHDFYTKKPMDWEGVLGFLKSY